MVTYAGMSGTSHLDNVTARRPLQYELRKLWIRNTVHAG